MSRRKQHRQIQWIGGKSYIIHLKSIFSLGDSALRKQKRRDQA
ncbi:hypothetical protein [Paenibacillus albiflavus]|nr:hypothetical protein [Paenibacillus albiflavus]